MEMTSSHVKMLVLVFIGFFILNKDSFAGPPFTTDDPEPVKFKHWEYYIASINTFQPTIWKGTCPHVEVNYGIIPNVQLHLLLPLNYDFIRHGEAHFGYAYSEFGVKYRFVQETENMPQVGTFPILEIPTIQNGEFGNGKTQVYLPIWLQKSWNKITSYGGAGYWFNPGTGSKNWFYAGWELQYEFSSVATLGGEVYFHSADSFDTKSVTAFNVGGILNASEKIHVIFSVGHNLTNNTFVSSYLGILWTI